MPDNTEYVPDMSAPELPTLGRLGEYLLLEKLGEGGVGEVFKSLHTELNRIVALKTLTRACHADPQAVVRFKQEMKALGQLDHPNIVRAHDAREIAHTFVLVMEYVDGLDLAALLKRVGRLSVADACEVVRQTASGLQHVHDHGLVHRDIKPSNLMLRCDGQVKILDLGLAHLGAAWSSDKQTTAVGQIIGTPDFMAPEQASDSHLVDIRADIYSLGCTLYCSLAGQPPFADPSHRTPLSTIVAHQTKPVPPITRHRADMPNELVDILNRTLAKSPSQRYGTPREVAEALEPFSAQSDLRTLLASDRMEEPSPMNTRSSVGTCDPVSEPKTDGRLRHRWIYGVAATIAVLMVVALGYFLFQRPHDVDGQHARTDQAGKRPHVGKQTTRDHAAVRNASPSSPSLDLGRESGSEWIVLSWKTEAPGKPNLWFFSPDGKQRRRLTSAPDWFDMQPTFSPDGRHVAFVRADRPGRSTEIYVCDTDGDNLQQLVPSRTEVERMVAPIWISNTSLCFTKAVRSENRGVWQIDLDAGEPRLLFQFADVVGVESGVATDISPDGQRLVVIAGKAQTPATSDVYLVDFKRLVKQSVWEDAGQDCRDAIALWSSDGNRIAWQHFFSTGDNLGSASTSVGWFRLDAGAGATAHLLSPADESITPLAWSPDGRSLLCARLVGRGQRPPQAAIFLINDSCEALEPQFQLDAWWQPVVDRESGRIADWAILPPDAPLPPANE